LNPSDLPSDLRGQVSEILSIPRSELVLEVFGTIKNIPDETVKLTARAAGSKPVAMILFASENSPKMVLRGSDRARAAVDVLDSRLGRIPLLPIGEGVSQGRTFSVSTLLQSWSSNRILRRAQTELAVRPILDWLHGTAAVTKRASDDGGDSFAEALEYLKGEAAMPAPLRTAAADARHRLNDREWSPFHVLMHGDLWRGNFLFDFSQRDLNLRERFRVIDWAGSSDRGYAIYDLIRMADSFSLSPRRLRAETEKHCKTLDCSLVDGLCQLLTALGHVGLNREQFPLERYCRMSNMCFTRYLDATGLTQSVIEI
jgi:hypothetical protein